VDEKFPPTDLDLDVLVKRVRKLVKAYPLIQRITLHELDGELPRYLISVEVENLVTGKPAACVGLGTKCGLGCKVPPGSRFRGVFAGFRARESAVTQVPHFLHPHQPDFPGERGVWSFVLGVFMDW
jgi:hypothetical protein